MPRIERIQRFSSQFFPASRSHSALASLVQGVHGALNIVEEFQVVEHPEANTTSNLSTPIKVRGWV